MHLFFFIKPVFYLPNAKSPIVLSSLVHHSQALRERKDPSLTGQTFHNDLEIIASLLPTKRRYERFTRVDDDEEDEEIHRELTEMMIRLCWARAHQSLADLHAEKDMLAKAPPEENEDAERAAYDARDKQKGKGKADGTWKLDGSRAGGPDGKGALIDAKGKVRCMKLICVGPCINSFSPPATETIHDYFCASRFAVQGLPS